MRLPNHPPADESPERTGSPWVRGIMAIEKESSGVPEVDFGRRTTKVNLWMIVGVAIFFVITAGIVVWYATR